VVALEGAGTDFVLKIVIVTEDQTVTYWEWRYQMLC
jgi:hypothetical protein